MTLLELLLAFALLALLVVATTSWTTMAARFGTKIEGSLARESSAESFLRFVHDSIITGDFGGDEESDEQPRVSINHADGSLAIRTRTRGAECVIRFAHDAREKRLTANEQVLLDGLTDAEWTIDDEQRTLTIRLVLHDDSTATRRLALP
jgi:hypothetical protein